MAIEAAKTRIEDNESTKLQQWIWGFDYSIHVRPLPAKHEEKKSCGCQVIRRAGFAEDVMLVDTGNRGNTHKQYLILREYFHPLSG